MVSGHGCQRQPSCGSRHCGLTISQALTCSRITQLELAQACGYEYPSFMSQIEAGKGRIPPEKYEMFAKSYKVDTKWFAQNLLHFTDPYMHRMLFSSNG